MKKFLALLTISFLLICPAIAQKKDFTSDQYFKENFTGIMNKLPIVAGWQDDEHYILVKNGNRFLVDATTGREEKITGENVVLSGRNTEQASVYIKDNAVYTRINGVEQKLFATDEKILNPELSPDNKFVGYTKNNDLYTYQISNSKETRLTIDGSEDILNGYASWVYMEEILGRASRYKAWWWAPDSKNIAYFKSDQSKVPTYILTDIQGLQTVEERTKYPKVGDHNPEVKVGIVSPTGGKTTWSDFNEKNDQYFGLPYWKPDGSGLLVQWMNRLQDSLIVYDVNINTGAKKPFYTEQQKTWINLDDNDRFRFINDGKNILVQSDKTGWMQLYNYDISGKLKSIITTTGYTVTDVNFIDEKTKTIYFTARGKENSAHKDFYRVSFEGKNMKRLSFGDYNHAVYNMSPSGKYFFTYHSNVSTPTKISLVNNEGKIISEIADSKAAALDDYNVAKTTFIRVKSDDGKFALPLKITWPLNMDKNKKYPVLVSIYGGPDAGTAWDSWSFSGAQQWYAKEGMIQVVMDHRASGHFGKEGVNYMYHNLGYWEIKDYTTMVKWLIDSAQADPARVCITGFSYGGYMSCYATTYAADVFPYGMAGGSVTDWRLYDSHYTERYMGTPLNNPEGYKTSSVLPYVSKYKGMLQIVHGIMDDNVHLENSIALTSALQDNKKNFEYMTYSSGRHGWTGDKRKHFDNLKTSFIYKYLLEKAVPEGLLK